MLYCINQAEPLHNTRSKLMTTIAALAVFLLLPIIVILWITETKDQRITRLSRKHGWTQRRIAHHMGISQSNVSRRLARIS